MKNIGKNLFIFSLGILVCLGGVYAADTITSSDVTYSNTTVEGALNDLYAKANIIRSTTAGASDVMSGKKFVTSSGILTDGTGQFMNYSKLYTNGTWANNMSLNTANGAAVSGSNWTPRNGSYTNSSGTISLSITSSAYSSICLVSTEKITINSDILLTKIATLSGSPSYIGFSSDRTVKLTDTGVTLGKSGNALFLQVLDRTGYIASDISSLKGNSGYLFIIVANTGAAAARSISISDITLLSNS